MNTTNGDRPSRAIDALQCEAAREGYPLDTEVAGRLGRYVDLLVTWGQRIRLTGTADVGSIVSRHLPDAIALTQVLDGIEPGWYVDVGAGAGLPAVFFGILCPQWRLSLVEPNAKRCAFLRTVLHELGLDGEVQQALFDRARVDHAAVLAARATFPLDRWLSLAATRAPARAGVLAFLVQDDSPIEVGCLSRQRMHAYDLADSTPRAIALYTQGTAANTVRDEAAPAHAGGAGPTAPRLDPDAHER